MPSVQGPGTMASEKISSCLQWTHSYAFERSRLYPGIPRELHAYCSINNSFAFACDRNGNQSCLSSAAAHLKVWLLSARETDSSCLMSVSFHDTTYDVTLLHASLKAICTFTPSYLVRVARSERPFYFGPPRAAAMFASEGAE